EYVRERIFQLLEARGQDVRLAVFFLGQVPRVDLAGAGLLADLHRRLAEKDITLRLAEAHGEGRDALRRSGFERLDGPLGSGRTERAGGKGGGGAVIASLVALLLLPARPAVAAQSTPPAQAAQNTESRDLEANEAQPAPVLIEGEPIIWVHGGAGAYTPEFRAARITRRIDEVVHDRTVRDIAVTIT